MPGSHGLSAEDNTRAALAIFHPHGPSARPKETAGHAFAMVNTQLHIKTSVTEGGVFQLSPVGQMAPSREGERLAC